MVAPPCRPFSSSAQKKTLIVAWWPDAGGQRLLSTEDRLGRFEVGGQEDARWQLEIPTAAVVDISLPLTPQTGRYWTMRSDVEASGAMATISYFVRSTDDEGELIRSVGEQPIPVATPLLEQSVNAGQTLYQSVNLGRPPRAAAQQRLIVRVETSAAATIDFHSVIVAAKRNPTPNGEILSFLDARTLARMVEPLTTNTGLAPFQLEQRVQLGELVASGHGTFVVQVRLTGGANDPSAWDEFVALLDQFEAELGEARFVLLMSSLHAFCDEEFYVRPDPFSPNVDLYAVPGPAYIRRRGTPGYERVSDGSIVEALPGEQEFAVLRARCAERPVDATNLERRIRSYVDAAQSDPERFVGLYVVDEASTVGLPVRYQHELHRRISDMAPQLSVMASHSFYLGSGGAFLDRQLRTIGRVLDAVGRRLLAL